MLPPTTEQSKEEVRMRERSISKKHWTKSQKPEVRVHLEEAEIRIRKGINEK